MEMEKEEKVGMDVGEEGAEGDEEDSDSFCL